MTSKVLTRKSTDVKNATVYFEDDELIAGVIVIDQDAYDATLDREYDVRDIDEIFLRVEETGTTNGLTYKVQETHKTFNKLSDLVAADFVDGFIAEVGVAAGAFAEDVVAKTLDITALKLRVRRTTAAMNAELAGTLRGK